MYLRKYRKQMPGSTATHDLSQADEEETLKVGIYGILSADSRTPVGLISARYHLYQQTEVACVYTLISHDAREFNR